MAHPIGCTTIAVRRLRGEVGEDKVKDKGSQTDQEKYKGEKDEEEELARLKDQGEDTDEGGRQEECLIPPLDGGGCLHPGMGGGSLTGV